MQILNATTQSLSYESNEPIEQLMLKTGFAKLVNVNRGTTYNPLQHFKCKNLLFLVWIEKLQYQRHSFWTQTEGKLGNQSWQLSYLTFKQKDVYSKSPL